MKNLFESMSEGLNKLDRDFDDSVFISECDDFDYDDNYDGLDEAKVATKEVPFKKATKNKKVSMKQKADAALNRLTGKSDKAAKSSNNATVNESIKSLKEDKVDPIDYRHTQYLDYRGEPHYIEVRNDYDKFTTPHYVSKHWGPDDKPVYDYNDKNYKGVPTGRPPQLGTKQAFIFNKPISRSGKLKKYAKILVALHDNGPKSRQELLAIAGDERANAPGQWNNFWVDAKKQGLIKVEKGLVLPGENLDDWYNTYIKSPTNESCNKTNKRSLTEKRWSYKLKSGKALRQAVDDEDYDAVKDGLIAAYKEINEAMPEYFDESDLEQAIFDLEGLDLDEDELNFALNDFYDLCDNLGIWVDMNESITESKLNESSMSRNEMIDWIDDNYNTQEGFEQLDAAIDAIGYDSEHLDDSDDNEGLYANFSDEDLENIISVLKTGKTKDGYDTSIKPQKAPLTDKAVKDLFKRYLEGIGPVREINKGTSSTLVMYDVSIQGQTFRVQVYKMY